MRTALAVGGAAPTRYVAQWSCRHFLRTELAIYRERTRPVDAGVVIEYTNRSIATSRR
jgi:hypothetical protein